MARAGNISLGVDGDDRRIGSCVLVNKVALLEVLTKNLAGHREKFLAALDGWQKTVTIELEKALLEAVRLAKNGREFRTHVSLHLPQPEDHTYDYEDVIAAVEWQQTDEILLDRNDFTKYVRDEWLWSAAFEDQFTTYSKIG